MNVTGILLELENPSLSSSLYHLTQDLPKEICDEISTVISKWKNYYEEQIKFI